MRDDGVKLFSRAYKLAAVRRMLAGENVSALARELGVRRKYLYQWRGRVLVGGGGAVRRRRGPAEGRGVAVRPAGGGGAGGGRGGGAPRAAPRATPPTPTD